MMSEYLVQNRSRASLTNILSSKICGQYRRSLYTNKVRVIGNWKVRVKKRAFKSHFLQTLHIDSGLLIPKHYIQYYYPTLYLQENSKSHTFFQSPCPFRGSIVHNFLSEHDIQLRAHPYKKCCK